MSTDWDAVRSEQRRRWQNGEQIRLEGLIPDETWRSIDPNIALDLVYAEVCLREDFGDHPKPEDYFDRLPSQAGEIQKLFELHRALLGSDEAAGAADSSSAKSVHFANRISSGGHHSRFQILKHHASGGLGDVFEARDTEFDRVVALKQVRNELRDRPDVNSRFRDEAVITARLEHPGIVPVYGLADDGEGGGYAMRLVHGRTMREAIDEFHAELRKSQNKMANLRFGLVQLLRNLALVSRTIAFAHDRGIVHRDIKPENIILGSYGECLVIDWGLAVECGGSNDDTTTELPDDRAAVSGTFEYMSPEQALGKPASAAGDIFSLGALLYCLLTGGPPYRGASTIALAEQAQRGDVTPPRQLQNSTPRSLEAICLHAMQREPQQRFATAIEFAEEIERWIAGEPLRFELESWSDRAWRWTRRHRRVAVAAVGGLLLTTAVSIVAIVLVRQEQARTESAAAVSTEMVELASEILVSTEPMAFSGVGLPAARPSSPKALQELSEEALRRLNASAMRPRDQARFSNALGNIYRSMGDYEAASNLLNHAHQLRVADSLTTDEELAESWHHLGWLDQDLGRYDIAAAKFKNALSLRTQALGSESLPVAETKFQLAWALSANAAFRQQLFDPAVEELMNDVLTVRTKILGPSHRLVGITRLAQAGIKFSRKKYGEALATLNAAYATFNESGENWPLEKGLALYLQAAIARHSPLRDRELADTSYQQALAEARSVLGSRHPIVVLLLGDYAGFLRDTGRGQEGERVFDEAIEIGRKSLAKGHPLMVRGLLDYARYLVQQQRVDESRQIAIEAYEAGKRNLGDEHPLVQRAKARVGNLQGP